MIITHQGDFKVSQPREEVYDLLTDPHKFAPLLPDFQSLEVQDSETFVVKIKVGVSHIRGTATVRLSNQERRPPEHAAYKGTGSMAGGSVTLGAAFNLVAASQGTVVNWEGQAQIFGKIASLARGLLEPLTKKNIQALIDSLQRAMENQSGASPTQSAPETVAKPETETEP